LQRSSRGLGASPGQYANSASKNRELWEVTQPEMVPFVSDEANWYDFDYLEDEQLLGILDDNYGIPLKAAPEHRFPDDGSAARSGLYPRRIGCP
jgi:hypothetical protein